MKTIGEVLEESTPVEPSQVSLRSQLIAANQTLDAVYISLGKATHQAERQLELSLARVQALELELDRSAKFVADLMGLCQEARVTETEAGFVSVAAVQELLHNHLFA